MSHITESESQMREIGIIKSALKDLGIAYAEGADLIGTYIKTKTTVDLLLDRNGDKSVGLKKNDEGVYSFIGDISMSTGFSLAKDQIEQRYSVRLIKKNLAKMNMQGVKERVLEDGTVKLIATA